MPNAPSATARGIQLLFLALLLLWMGLSLHAMQHPRDAFSSWSDALFIHGEVLLAQLPYPVFAGFTRGLAWAGAWRVLRIVQGMVVGLLVAGFLLLLLATPDVSGFTS